MATKTPALLFLLLFPVLALANRAAMVEPVGIDLFFQPGKVCAVEAAGVSCWGNGTAPEIPNYSFDVYRPTEVIPAGSEQGCLTAHEGTTIYCWDGIGNWRGVVTGKQHLHSLSTYGLHGCAVADDGVTCWDGDKFGAAEVPALSRPSMVSVGNYHSCALDGNLVRCWGADFYGQLRVPALYNPWAIASGYNYSCAVDQQGVKCWGRIAENGTPQLVHPRTISSSGEDNCAIDDNGVHCWNIFGTPWRSDNVPSLFSPRAVWAGSEHRACALDDLGLHCWGGVSNEDRVPGDLQERVTRGVFTGPVTLENLDEKIFLVSKLVYRYKAGFFEQVSRELKKVPRNSPARAFTLKAVAIVLENTRSQDIQEKVLPHIRRQIQKLGAGGLQIGDPETLRMALSLCSAALLTSRDFISSPYSRDLEQTLSSLMQLQANLGKPSARREARELLDSQADLITATTLQERIRGFGLMVDSIRQALGTP